MLGMWSACPTEKRAARLPDYEQSYQQRERAENLHHASSWHAPTLTPKASVRVRAPATRRQIDSAFKTPYSLPYHRPVGAPECLEALSGVLALSNGWMVRVTKPMGDGPPLIQIYAVAE